MTKYEVNEQQIQELKRSLQKSQWTLNDLATMGAMITSIRDIDTILSVVMEMSIRMVEGEVGLIQLEENGVLTSKVNWGVDDSVIKSILYKDNEDISNYCYRTGKALLVENFEQELNHGPSISSYMALPIKSSDRCHGTIVIINKVNEGCFTEDDKNNVDMLINFAAVSIDNCLLLAESLKKQKIEQELAIARQIQETILPDSEVKIKGIDVGTIYYPAREVGGDFYDIVKLNESEFYVVIGDVSNKGIPAALVMTATSAIIKSEIKNNSQISTNKLMASLNSTLCDGIIKSHEMFATLFIARFDLIKKKLVYCNGGHLPPLFWDSVSKSIVELREGGTFVGQFPDAKYIEGVRTISRGDSMFAFTDGLTEAANAYDDLFGTERAIQVLLAGHDVSASEFCVKVKEWINRFVEGGSEESVDDFTIMKLNINIE